MSKEKNTPYFLKRLTFYPIILQHNVLKMPHSYAEYHHFIMMSLMSGEHNTLALSLQDESPVWCLWADVAAKLRSLKRYSVFTFQRMKFMNRTSPIIFAAQYFPY